MGASENELNSPPPPFSVALDLCFTVLISVLWTTNEDTPSHCLYGCLGGAMTASQAWKSGAAGCTIGATRIPPTHIPQRQSPLREKRSKNNNTVPRYADGFFSRP
jgi:hypothetical protein